jgi:hypothetical protein
MKSYKIKALKTVVTVSPKNLIVKSTTQDTIHSAQNFESLRLARPTYHTRDDLQRDPYRPEERWNDSIAFEKIRDIVTKNVECMGSQGR